MQSRPHILAVDGGGSTCRVRIAATDGAPLGEATGGPANINSDFDAALHNLRRTIAQATAHAGLEQLAPVAAHLGLAGANASPRSGDVAEALNLPDAVVTSDREPTLEGAFAGGDGIVALFGTGSFFAARRGDRISHLGGWGFALGDTGGGAWMGRRLLRETVRAHDRQRPHSALSRKVLADHGGTPVGLVAFATHATPGDFATFAPDIIRAARQGDPLAAEIITRAITELRSGVATLDPLLRVPVCLLGGLGRALTGFMPEDLAGRMVAAKGDPLDGATALALKAAAQ